MRALLALHACGKSWELPEHSLLELAVLRQLHASQPIKPCQENRTPLMVRLRGKLFISNSTSKTETETTGDWLALKVLPADQQVAGCGCRGELKSQAVAVCGTPSSWTRQTNSLLSTTPR